MSENMDFPLRLDSLEFDEAALSVELEALSRELGEISSSPGTWETLSGD